MNLDYNLTSSKSERAYSAYKKNYDNPLIHSSPPENIVIKCEAPDLSYGDIKEEDNPSSSLLFDSSTFLQFYKQENPKENESENNQGNNSMDIDPIECDLKVKDDPGASSKVQDTSDESESDWFNDAFDDSNDTKDEKPQTSKSKSKSNAQLGKKRGKYKKTLTGENLVCDICGE